MDLWHDDSGAVLSTELVLLTAVVAIGVTAGLREMAAGVNAGLTEIGGTLSEVGQAYRQQVRGVLPVKDEAKEQVVITAGDDMNERPALLGWR